MTEAPSNHPAVVPQTGGTQVLGSTLGSLFLISVLGLFLELLLIRWISTEIRIFAYLQNTVLVVCFLGLGMGCWDSRRPFALRDILIPLAILVTLLALPPTRVVLGSISTMLSSLGDLVIWGDEESSRWSAFVSVGIGLALTFALMVLLWEIFVPVGRLLGRLMADDPRIIRAYSVNVAGSLIGIWLFVLASALYLPPAVWFIVFAALAAAFVGTGGKSSRVDVGLLVGIITLAAAAGYEPGYEEIRWTPYQKLALVKNVGTGENQPEWMKKVLGLRPILQSDPGRIQIAVNNTGYQAMMDLRPQAIGTGPRDFPPEQRGYSQYDLPPKLHPKPTSMLVVGAGSGNDAAGALRNGVERVVAVEIDPGIIEYGRRLHPERPYEDPRCTVVNDDARSYFATCAEKFDVIAFGLLDSHTTTAMTNARLDHYVYTIESITHARKLLNPGGVMVLSFEAQKPYIADRMGTTLKLVFGQDPLVFRVPSNGYGWGGVLFAVGEKPDAISQGVAANPGLGKLIAEWQSLDRPELTGTTQLATDDWPYIYLETPRIPALYFLLAVVLLLLFARGLWQLKPWQHFTESGRWGRAGWHFFFLGVGFMLLEVQNVSKAAVVLGNTWAVNAVIISSVMVMILLANLIAARFPRLPLQPVYALLLLSCIGLYFVDLSRFAFLPYATKALVVGLLTSLPMLFSGIVFIRSFAAAERKDAALGANLFGALVGGLLQSVTFVTGVKALLLLVAGFYLLAVLTRPAPARTQA